ncbi:MAG: IS110 family transposase [Candidatus Symbiobacter sp.]|nr:IS110 family transposase [Candidatus Symbiobacter sp.]
MKSSKLANSVLTPCVLGCDVSKDKVDFFNAMTGESFTVANKKKELTKALKAQGTIRLAVCEATGEYENTLLAALVALKAPAHRADPQKAYHFAKSRHSYKKTDKIDAESLAAYGMERGDELALWVPPAAHQIELKKLAHYRQTLVDMRANLRKLASSPGADKTVKELNKKTIDHLKGMIAKVEEKINSLLARHDDLAKKAKIIQSVKGCGNITAIILLAFMPELGTITGKQAASLCGLAPRVNQSGGKDGRRFIKGGRKPARNGLFMVGLCASKYNLDLKEFYDRLVKKGKKRIQAVVAVARKLIVILNAMIRDSKLAHETN